MKIEEDHTIKMLQRIAEGIICLNQDEEIVFVNEAGKGFLQIPDGLEFQGKAIWELIRPEVREELYSMMAKSKSTLQTIHSEIYLTSLSKWIDCTIYPSAENSVIMIKNITAIKSVEEAFRKKNLRLTILSETTSQLLSKDNPKDILDSLFNELSLYLNLDTFFNYIYDEKVNKLKLMNSSGVPEAMKREIEWLNIGEAVCGKVAETKEKIVKENIDQSDEECLQIIKNIGIKAYACYPLISFGKFIGTLSFGSTARAAFSDEELNLIPVICSHVAITLERIFFISKLKFEKEEAEKANRTKSDFLSMMSHELRNPLNSILGFGQILYEDEHDPLSKEQSKKLKRILNSSRQLLTLINDTLNVAKAEYQLNDILAKPIQVGPVLMDCINMVQSQLTNKQITLLCNVDFTQLPLVLADSKRLQIILLNLLTNAIKFSNNQGTIKVTCNIQEYLLEISIEDFGIGIPKKEHERIFEPFYRIFHPTLNIEGTGIGLSLVKQFIEQLHGKVRVESEPGIGSCFKISLPAYLWKK
ncbi:GAF domain-containing sensor histidine kinase [Heyndrickxia acidicola]|uniref:histidine kinase n=1 Tax=Heyndrickxia acidicola TaxID=209389 RepID=A0ABU6MMY7_9BACI|nr:ATP-binding protein [Heyndrickxia acidicola]MED1205728.1 ATP-binding protein [Heyndrickxia acidicola]